MKPGALLPLSVCLPLSLSLGAGNDFLNGSSDVDIKPFSGEVSNRMIALLSELVDKELVSTIVWAKQIPGFTDLELNDQMRLLQSSWAEILALSLSYRTQQIFNSNSSTPNTPTNPCNSISITNGNSKVNLTIPNKLVFTTDFIMEQSHAIECKAEDMFGYCLQLQKRMVPLAISKQEYVLLKALLLMNVGRWSFAPCFPSLRWRRTQICTEDRRRVWGTGVRQVRRWRVSLFSVR